jgi:hypothetical protein
MSVVSHVDATFDGEKRRFELRRDRIVAFEERLRRHAHDDDITMGASAYAALKRFHGGGWLASDVEQSLAFGLETQTKEQVQLAKTARILSAHAAKFGGATIADTVETHTPGKVMPAIIRDGHGAYVRLAEVIVRAALLGITAEEADFDSYKDSTDVD